MKKQPRNQPCACGSGKKYKKCHLLIEMEEARLAEIAWKQRMVERAAAAQRKREEGLKHMARQPFGGSAIGSLLMLSVLTMGSGRTKPWRYTGK